jgi:E3 ubiquitin-protein ligase HACE1
VPEFFDFINEYLESDISALSGPLSFLLDIDGGSSLLSMDNRIAFIDFEADKATREAGRLAAFNLSVPRRHPDMCLEVWLSNVMNRLKGYFQGQCLSARFFDPDTGVYEEGYGIGPTREFFSVIAENLLQEVFETSPNGQWMLPSGKPAFCSLAGRIVALSFLSDAGIDMSMLSPILWQYVQEGDIQFEPDMEKMESWDPDYANSLKWILAETTSDEDLENACIETGNNRFQYVQSIIREKLHVSEMENFRSGFYSAITESWIDSLFSFRELAIVFGGPTVIDIEDWMRETRYTGGFDEDHVVIDWYWKFVLSLTAIERRVLLSFVTGMTRAPVGGFCALTTAGGEPMPFTILRTSCLPGEEPPLPTAATCFNLLKLPEYQSEDILSSKLHTAIRLGSVGFTFG